MNQREALVMIMEPNRSHMPAFSQIALDAALAVALVVTLASVVGLDSWIKPSKPESAEATIEQVAQEPEPLEQSPSLRLGVTPASPEYDNMAKLLDGLGEGYKYRTFPMDDLLDDTKLANFDIVFLTCSGYPAKWLGRQTGDSARGGGLFAPNEEVFTRAKESLRQFVARGGTLYASDLHFNLVANCFPEFVDLQQVDQGDVQQVTAEVVDPGLSELIGSKVELRFDQPGWRPAAFDAEKSTCYLRGEFQSSSGQHRSGPLLVKCPFQDGNIIFTSFHNEKQNSETETKLLRYLVFAAVTAKVESQVTKTMVRGGFAPAKQNLFSASSGQRSVSKTYNCTKTTDLKFVLGFADQGARLKLTVKRPDGKVLEREGTSTITIDVSGAEVGVWTYTVTALQIPNENFAFTVTVGQK
jgi:hypothetical protein